VTLGVALSLRRLESLVPATPMQIYEDSIQFRRSTRSIVPVHVTIGILLTEDSQLRLGSDFDGFSAYVSGDWNWWWENDELHKLQEGEVLQPAESEMIGR
jgi:hypothetical protein